MTLPPEIWSRIIHDATAVPAALDSAPDEPTTSIRAAIKSSMKAKLALSLVSKAFHDLTDQFLYETISILPHRPVRPLAELLRQNRSGRCCRGWWCRHLEVKLDCSEEEWAFGGLTLWGLLPSCPNVSYLRIIHVSVPQAGWPNGFLPSPRNFPVRETLFHVLASTCGASLKHLELEGPFVIPFELVERLFMYTNGLEVCRLFGLKMDSTAGSPDDDRLVEWAIVSLRNWSPVEAQEYDTARQTTRFPVSPDTGIVMPHLHTLAMGPFSAAVDAWSLPSLRSIEVNMRGNGEDPDQVLRNMNSLKTGLARHASLITSFVYHDGPSSLDFYEIVHFLPALERATYHIHGNCLVFDMLAVPHPTLRTIELCRSHLFTASIIQPLDDVVIAVQLQMLPALKTVRVSGDCVGEEHVIERKEELSACGVALECTREGDFTLPC